MLSSLTCSFSNTSYTKAPTRRKQVADRSGLVVITSLSCRRLSCASRSYCYKQMWTLIVVNWQRTSVQLNSQQVRRSTCSEAKQVSAAADRPARRSASGPPCCTQMSTVSVINWWPTTVTSLPHWPSTLVDSTGECACLAHVSEECILYSGEWQQDRDAAFCQNTLDTCYYYYSSETDMG